MEYRILPHGGEKISIIGLGSGSIGGNRKEMVEIIDTAIKNGINYWRKYHARLWRRLH